MKDKDYEKWANAKIEKAIASHQKIKKIILSNNQNIWQC